MIYKLYFIFIGVIFMVGCGSKNEDQPSWQVPNLSLGSPDLKQDVIWRGVDKGVDFYDISRGNNSQYSYFLTSGVLNFIVVDEYKGILEGLGVDFSISSVAELSPQGEDIGGVVRIRGFDSKEDADIFSEFLLKNGLNFNSIYDAEDGLETTGPFLISLLRIDLNEFNGEIVSSLANNKVQDAETVSSMSRRENAIAGVNGGFFVFNEEVGDYGAPAGVYVKDGVLIREASNDRPVLILDNSEKKTGIQFGYSIRTELFLKQGDNNIQLNGLNRRPGFNLNCGGYESKPILEVAHDFLCTNSDEIIAFNGFYGEFTPNSKAAELIFSDEGELLSLSNSTNTKIEPGKTYIQLTGNKEFHINDFEKIELIIKIYVDDEEVVLKPGVSMVSAGPTLLMNGNKMDGYRSQQGWNPFPMIENSAFQLASGIENRERFYEAWVLRRHPRTAIGLSVENILYIVVVYGRNPGVSEGATITEMSNLMHALGANDAMNLDGGGSSVMVVNNLPTGPFSDPQERMVSDAVLLISNN